MLNKVALKAKFIKAYPHDTSASCLAVEGGIREWVGPREDRGKDVRKRQEERLAEELGIKLKSVLSQASQIASPVPPGAQIG